MYFKFVVGIVMTSKLPMHTLQIYDIGKSLLIMNLKIYGTLYMWFIFNKTVNDYSFYK